MGKTTFALNVAMNAAIQDGKKVAIFSLEMSAEQLAARVLSEAAEVPSEQIRRGDMTEAEFRRFVEAAKAQADALFRRYGNLHRVGRNAEFRHIELDEDLASAIACLESIYGWAFP